MVATYWVSMDDGRGGSEAVEADSLAEAVEWAREWAEGAEWPHGKRGDHEVTVASCEDETEAESFSV